jgi:hypothetical protein
MSSKVTGDAQPDAGTEAETDYSLPTGIVGNFAGAGAVAENTEPRPEPTPEPAAESAPGKPTEAMDSAKPADRTESTGLPEGEAEAEAEQPENPWGPADLADPTELIAEPTELMAMTEPVDLAEPVEERNPKRRGHGVLIAFVFVVAAAAIVGGAFVIVGSLTHGFKKPVIIHYKKSAIFSLKTGECINPNGQAATIVSCSTPHDAEVFATFPLSGSNWPGATAVRTAASSGCSTRLTGYLNPQLAISLASTYIYPDSVAWQAGTRTVICEVRATSGQLTGSVRGATASAS